MIKYKAAQRKVDMYDIGDGLTLMNVILNNEEGQMSEINTYSGQEGYGYSCVGYTGLISRA